jgi:hypothetical protein
MCVDCVLASPRIAQVDPGDGPLPEVVLSQVTLGEAMVTKAWNSCVQSSVRWWSLRSGRARHEPDVGR